MFNHLFPGIQYTIGRVPMASCDFSMREYSYNDVEGDFNMSHFALEYEDLHYKLSNRLFYYTDRF